MDVEKQALTKKEHYPTSDDEVLGIISTYIVTT